LVDFLVKRSKELAGEAYAEQTSENEAPPAHPLEVDPATGSDPDGGVVESLDEYRSPKRSNGH